MYPVVWWSIGNGFSVCCMTDAPVHARDGDGSEPNGTATLPSMYSANNSLLNI